MTLNQLRHNILVQESDNQPLIEQLTIPGLCIPEPHQKSESIHHTQVSYQDQNLEKLHTPFTPSEDFVQLSLFPEDFEI
jgi:hypothetical protein